MLDALTFHREDMSISRPEVFKNIIKIVLIGSFFRGKGWIQLEIFRQRSTTELETLSKDNSMELILDVQY